MTNPEPGELAIRRARKARYWSVRRMAQEISATGGPREAPSVTAMVRNITRWEAGGPGPSERYRLLYCKVLGMTEAELFDDETT
jgi:transcriptional regulator with XRE-family HTH domain